MAIPHQQSTDHMILMMRLDWSPDDMDRIVRIAESAAEQEGKTALTRGHVMAAESRFMLTTGRRRKGARRAQS